jgi:hypothetical protein
VSLSPQAEVLFFFFTDYRRNFSLRNLLPCLNHGKIEIKSGVLQPFGAVSPCRSAARRQSWR